MSKELFFFQKREQGGFYSIIANVEWVPVIITTKVITAAAVK